MPLDELLQTLDYPSEDKEVEDEEVVGVTLRCALPHTRRYCYRCGAHTFPTTPLRSAHAYRCVLVGLWVSR